MQQTLEWTAHGCCSMEHCSALLDLAPEELESCLILHCIGQYLYWPKLLEVIFCNCFCTWTVQLTRGVFHLDISFRCWFSVTRAPICVVWTLFSLYQRCWRTWRLWIRSTCNWISKWCRRQGIRRYCNGSYRGTLGSFLNMCLRSVKSCWDYFPQLQKYQDFWSTRFCIEEIVLYLSFCTSEMYIRLYSYRRFVNNHAVS
jgi:hypothetical protein